jgi:hypothetical protein
MCFKYTFFTLVALNFQIFLESIIFMAVKHFGNAVLKWKEENLQLQWLRYSGMQLIILDA